MVLTEYPQLDTKHDRGTAGSYMSQIVYLQHLGHPQLCTCKLPLVLYSQLVPTNMNFVSDLHPYPSE